MKTRISRFAPIAAIVGASVFAFAPANAADMILEPAPAPAPMDVIPAEAGGWAGTYLGVQGGYNFGRAQSDVNGNVRNEGFVGGAFAGVQGQSGSIVYGAEADVGYNGSRGNNGAVATRGEVDGSVRARLGYAVNDAILLYGTAGAAAQNLRVVDVAGRDRETMLGYTVGAGADAKLTEQVFGRLEYRYTDYGTKTFDTGSGPQRVGSQDNRVMMGLGVKF